MDELTWEVKRRSGEEKRVIVELRIPPPNRPERFMWPVFSSRNDNDAPCDAHILPKE